MIDIYLNTRRLRRIPAWSVALLVLVAGPGLAEADAVAPAPAETALAPTTQVPAAQVPAAQVPAAEVAPAQVPAPLSARDVRLYRKIFALQDAANWQAADRLIGRLQDPLLVGHLRRQRYMHPDAYRSTYDELSAWLEQYDDHPGADQVYRLALKRRPQGAPEPALPVRGYLGGSGQERQEVTEIDYRTTRERSQGEEATVRAWRERIDRLVRDRRPVAAAEELQDPAIRPLVDVVELDLARWAVARAYLALGDDLAALRLARRAAVRTGRIVPEIHWTAGISAWRLDRTALALRHFAALAEAQSAHPSERSRAAFWAARAHVVEQKPQQIDDFLGIAAEDAQSFYGLLARAVLGQKERYDWADRPPQDGTLRAVAQLPAARRALALGQTGRSGLAAQEIRKLAARAAPELLEGLIALAGTLDLPATQMRLAQSLRDRGSDHHGALYPLPSWRPAEGFTVDRALLFAVMRAESAFDPKAESHMGARGLMQIMPATAQEIAARTPLELLDQDDLFEPATAMMFGQAYLDQILRFPGIDDNLMFAAVAYNAGPGRVIQWRDSLATDPDPLLFLESIPLQETRIYVKKVLANLWTYRARLGQPQPSLDALASNDWPIYRALDPTVTLLHAWN